ncbi:DUF3261 domain-containing protein [Vibrio sp. S11_S32]|uniref:DUF3261 domain-containing protein n=1 Tax=Vibrio sp. S11_S32 TaxID=2720225 RepID=UPI0016804CF2|nr:DUF3261 domain-containing protein [Vibrio sp. S11_S32]MBD1575177.1 DUF3261 domain-containing protein [Vibrio sp. S11_S32]
MLKRIDSYHIKGLLVTAILLLLSACTANSVTSSDKDQAKVEIAKDVWVTLPTPNQLGYDLTASQLISVTYQDSNNQLPTQLQVSDNTLVLAGFSSWGTRILSLQYADNQIDSHVMTGLGNTLPKPQQVLFNLMITLWPIEVWQQPLSQLGWRLTQTDDPSSQGKQRQLIDDKGQVVADIHYQNQNALKGDITFINPSLGFTIKIKTLQYK